MAFDLVDQDILHLRIYCNAGDQLAINNIFYRATRLLGGNPTIDIAEFWEQMDEVCRTFYPPLMSSQANYRGVTAQCVRYNGVDHEWQYQNDPHGSAIHLTPGADDASDLLPRQVAGLVVKRTGFVGKRNRGRLYIPFPSEDMNENVTGVPTDQYVTDLTGLAINLMPPGGGGLGNTGDTPLWVWVPVLFSPSTIDASLQPPIMDTFGRKAWATQRRRGSFGKANSPFPI